MMLLKIASGVPCVLLIALAMILSGCASRISISANSDAVADVCEFAWKPQSWHIQDTDKTILEAKRGNARRAAWCGR